MYRPSLLLAATALLALGACSEGKVETAKARPENKVSIDIDGDDGKSGTSVMVNADSDTGKLELKLPGGIEAKVDMPEGSKIMGGDDTKFDIDGVGLFPGARVRSVNVNASNIKDSKTAMVKVGFSAPADAAVVADWYQQQFDAKRKTVTRSGETLSGATDDGDRFTIALEAAGTGASKGVVTITDSKTS